MEPIYLDHQATTPLDPRVRAAMLPWLEHEFGNPHSRTHGLGARAHRAVETARAQVAALIGAQADEIVFTAGATEANNLALRGAGRPVTALATEHPSVLENAQTVVGGFEELRGPLVAVASANNEIGTLAPVTKLAGRGGLLHVDAAQWPVRAEGIDTMALSAHKLYGPKGIGALYVRRGVELTPLMAGGGQERGLRPGTLSPALCVGFGAACAIWQAEAEAQSARLRRLADRLRRGLQVLFPRARLNGPAEPRLPGNLNVCFVGQDAEAVMLDLPELALASGAACASARAEPSHVLRAIGLSDEEIAASLRIGIGRFTSEAEIDRTLAAFARLSAPRRPAISAA